MKKFLSFILIFSLVSSLFALPVFASASSKNVVDTQKIVSDLGIIEADKELTDTITRGEFATAISKAINIQSMPSGYIIPYKDVAENSQCYEGVYNLYAWRAISEADYFRPDDVITSNEALKIAVAALGYDFLASANGGYPAGYVAAASQLGITAKNMGTQVTYANVYEIIYNMLHCKLSTITYTDGQEYNYSVKTGNTLLYEMWNITVASGVVTDGETFGIHNNAGVGEGFVGIDGLVLRKGEFDTDAFFGEEVEVYYDKDTKTVRSIYSTGTSGNSVTKIVSTQEFSFDNNTYTYIDDKEKEKQVKIKDDSIIVYNGKNTQYDKSIMVPEHGSVKLVCLEGKEADVVIIKSYTEMVAGTIVASSFLISDKSTDGVSYRFEAENPITYTTQNGKVTNFESIVENDVLWLAIDRNNEINDVIICSDVIVGELTGKASNGIYIDDRMYEATDSAYADALANYQFGSVVRGCINPDGDIVYFVSESDTSAYKVGYLMYSRLLKQGLSSRIVVKIIGDDGLYYQYETADKFIVNGIVFKDDDVTNYANLPKQEGYESSMAMSLILYVADRTDHITTINYPDNIAETINVNGKTGVASGLWKNGQITDLSDQYVQYKSSDKVLYSKGVNGRVFIGNPFTRFAVPDPKNTASMEDKDYKVQGFSSYNNNETHYAYALSENALESNYVVSIYYEGGGGDSHNDTSPLLLVNSVSQIINEDGMAVEKLEIVRNNGTTVEYYSEEEGYFSALNLKFGDLVKIEANSKNMVTGITVFYRSGEDSLAKATFSEDKDGKETVTLDTNLSGMKSKYASTEDACVYNSNSGMGTLAGSYIIMGDVYHRDGVVMQLLPGSIGCENYDKDTNTLYPFSMSSKSILICDLETETVETGTTNDVKSYLEFGDACNRAVIQAYSGTVNGIIIYQK